MKTHGELAVRILVDCRCTAGRPPSSTSISLITRWINDDAGSMHWPSTNSAWAAGHLFGCVGCNHAQRDGVWGGRERPSDQRRRTKQLRRSANAKGSGAFLTSSCSDGRMRHSQVCVYCAGGPPWPTNHVFFLKNWELLFFLLVQTLANTCLFSLPAFVI